MPVWAWGQRPQVGNSGSLPAQHRWVTKQRSRKAVIRLTSLCPPRCSEHLMGFISSLEWLQNWLFPPWDKVLWHYFYSYRFNVLTGILCPDTWTLSGVLSSYPEAHRGNNASPDVPSFIYGPVGSPKVTTLPQAESLKTNWMCDGWKVPETCWHRVPPAPKTLGGTLCPILPRAAWVVI